VMGMPDNPFNRGYFPDPSLAGEDGLLAAGGSLDTEVLLEAYSRGIFPWYAEGSPVLWWSPDPRMVLFPERFRVSGSLARSLKQRDLVIRLDSAFAEVIRQCADQPRPGQKGTWITRAMKDAYTRLHQAGYAHSVEVYRQDRLVGGLYGISLGAAFFGESMFHLERDASKVALGHLVEFARRHRFEFIDAQQSTAHLKSLGAVEMPREEFLSLLGKSLRKPTLRGSWSGSD
jgi:leucyl/phenylalanyl-tRNA--protein transferase